MNVHPSILAPERAYAAPESRFAPAPGGFDLRALLGVLLRRWAVVVAFPVVAALAAVALWAVLPPRYTAEVSLLIDPKRPGALGPDAEFASIYVDTTKVASVALILQSTGLLERVARAERLTEDAEFTAPGRGLAARLTDLVTGRAADTGQGAARGEAERLAVAVDRLRLATRITRDGFTYVVKIEAFSPDPAKATRLANAVADAYLVDQLEAKYDSARRATTWLQGRLEGLRGELQASERAVEEARQTYGLQETERGGGSTVGRQQVTELNAQLANARADTAQKRARYDQARRVRDTGGNVEALPEVLASPVIAGLRGQQGEAARKAAEAAQRYGPRHPEVLRISEEKRVTDAAIAAEVGRLVGNLKNDLDVSQGRERALETGLAAAAAEGGPVRAEGALKLRELGRIADANRALYESLLGRFKDTEQRATLQEAEARVISPARTPDAPSFPRLLPFLIVGLGLGAAAGLAGAFVVEQVENVYATPSQVERDLGKPVLASVPHLTAKDLEGGAQDILGYLAAKPFSRYAEAIRSARVGLRMADVDHPPRLIQVSSAVPGEGKSTLAASLALASALAETRTLLIDCDFRHPSASKLFRLGDRAGLVDLLTGDARWDEVVVRRADAPLDVVPAGRRAASPPDLLNSARMREILRLAAERYDLVIVDGPPVHAVSDALVLSTLVDRTLFVVEWCATRRDVVERAIAGLEIDERKIAGVVLNKVDVSRLTSYGYGYGEGYGYGHAYRALGKYYAA